MVEIHNDKQETTASSFTVEVVYALPERQWLVSLEVEQGCVATEAIRRSGILEVVPTLDIDTLKVGIFSQVLENPASYRLKAMDRVEIYRPLIADPKEVRRQRAKEAKAKRARIAQSIQQE